MASPGREPAIIPSIGGSGEVLSLGEEEEDGDGDGDLVGLAVPVRMSYISAVLGFCWLVGLGAAGRGKVIDGGGKAVICGM